MEIVQASGLYQISLGQCVMIGVGLLLLYLAIERKFEPLLLVPIGFGGILANIPGAGDRDRRRHTAPDLPGGRGYGRFPAAGVHGDRRAHGFWTATGQSKDVAPGRGCAVRHLRDVARRGGSDPARGHGLYPPGGGGHLHHRRRGRPDGDLCRGTACAAPDGRHRGRGLFVHGVGAAHPAAHHAPA